MLQAEHFEKNNFDILWDYIRYITKSTPYKIKLLTAVIYSYIFSHIIWKFVCIGFLYHLITFQTKQIWSSYLL